MNVFTVPMRLLTAVVLDESTDAVKKALLSLGVLDFIQVSHLAPEQAAKLSPVNQSEDPQTYAALRARVETLFQQASIPLPNVDRLDPEATTALDTGKAKALVDKVVAALSVLREQQKQLSQSRIRFEELLRYVENHDTQYIDVRIGNPAKGDAQLLGARLANQAYVLLQPADWKDMILLTLKRDRQQVSPSMDALGWTENPDGQLQPEALIVLKEHLVKQLEDLDASNVQIKQRITTRIQEDAETLEQLWCNLRLHELLGAIANNFSHTRNTTIFAGWVPKSSSDTLEQAIRKACGGTCVIEWTEAGMMPRAEIPVAVDDMPLLRPFQKLVDNYSVPEYGTINPTPFVAISYLVMFGLMFADAGQGLVILLLGLLGKRQSARNSGTARRMISTDMYQLFTYLGGASIITGILFGSYFGFALLPPVWFDYHAAVNGHDASGRSVYSILGITIWFGIAVIGTGLLLNWINLIRKRDWFHLVMDKNG